jgi:hypothetical protein
VCDHLHYHNRYINNVNFKQNYENLIDYCNNCHKYMEELLKNIKNPTNDFIEKMHMYILKHVCCNYYTTCLYLQNIKNQNENIYLFILNLYTVKFTKHVNNFNFERNYDKLITFYVYAKKVLDIMKNKPTDKIHYCILQKCENLSEKLHYYKTIENPTEEMKSYINEIQLQHDSTIKCIIM